MSKAIDISTAATRLGCTVRHARRMAAGGELPGAAKDRKGLWRVPLTAHPDLRREGPAVEADLTRIPAHRRRAAFTRLGHVQGANAAAAASIAAGGTRLAGLRAYARAQKLAERTLRRWISTFDDAGLAGLVDQRGGGPSNDISPEAWDFFLSLYLDQRRWSVKLCWQTLCHVNRSEGRDWTIPSLRTMQRLAEGRIPLPVRVLHREGMQAYNAQCAPYVQSDPDSIAPGAVWVGDHHQANCWVRYQGRWVRPWLTAWLDMRSRAGMGWHVSAGPNQTTILLAFRHGAQRHGPPDVAHVDNGRDYDSALFTGVTKAQRRALKAGYLDEPFVAGLYGMLGIEVSFALPYHPQSKNIERFFDTFDRQFVKTMPTYCGKDTARKPEMLARLLADTDGEHALTLEEFAARASTYIDTTYNRQGHSGTGMAGRSPLDVLNTRASRRVCQDGVLDLMCRVWSREIIVGKGGSIRVQRLIYGMGQEEMIVLQGRRVRAAYDPADLRSVHVYDAATLKLLAVARQQRLVAWGRAVADEDLRAAMRTKSKALRLTREARPAARVAAMELADLALEAQRDAAQADQAPAPSPPPLLRPVATVLDDQLAEHLRVESRQLLRRAAGAERPQAKLDLDLASLHKPSARRPKLF